ncbi:MAG: response regulator transcription factor [Sulfuricella sp.]|nr:response regulator transcription factor [Sulfuricella sp.]
MSATSDPSLIRVALVEDDVHFSNAFTAALEAAPDMKLASASATLAQALQALEQPPADVLVVDLGLPDGSGIEAIRAAHERWPGCAIMVSTTFADESHVLRSIEAGASGYLLKDSVPKKLTEEIRSLHGGGSPISPLIARQVLMRFRQGGVPTPAPARQRGDGDSPAVLSEREQQTLEFIARGFTYDEISGLMAVSRYTVMTFVRRIYTKLEVKSKSEAVYEARNKGLLAS